jgi:hypothetical protein
LVFLVGADLIQQGVVSESVCHAGAWPTGALALFANDLGGIAIAAQSEWSLSDQTPTHPIKSFFRFRCYLRFLPSVSRPESYTAESLVKRDLKESVQA